MGPVSRRKTTVYLDSDVLTATKVLAASRERSESQVVEDALRAYLAAGELEAASADLRALMARVAERADLDDEAAMTLAVDEVRAVRTGRRSAATSSVTPRAVAETNVLVAAAITPGGVAAGNSKLPSSTDGSWWLHRS